MPPIKLGRPIPMRATGPRGFSRIKAGRLEPWKLQVEGHQKLLDKLNKQKFWIQPTNESMLALQEYGFNKAKQRSPRLTNDTLGKIKKKTHKALFIRYADIILQPSLAKSDGKFRYSFALDAARRRAPRGQSGKGEFQRVRRTKLNKVPRKKITSHKVAPYKYRSGTFKAQRTFNWFHGTSKWVRKQLRTEALRTMRLMQAAWAG